MIYSSPANSNVGRQTRSSAQGDASDCSAVHRTRDSDARLHRLWFVRGPQNPDTPDPGAPDAERIAVGFFANFFDALGIGSFATTTTYFRLRKLVRDELIPGSLNVGYCAADHHAGLHRHHRSSKSSR